MRYDAASAESFAPCTLFKTAPTAASRCRALEVLLISEIFLEFVPAVRVYIAPVIQLQLILRLPVCAHLVGIPGDTIQIDPIKRAVCFAYILRIYFGLKSNRAFVFVAFMYKRKNPFTFPHTVVIIHATVNTVVTIISLSCISAKISPFILRIRVRQMYSPKPLPLLLPVLEPRQKLSKICGSSFSLRAQPPLRMWMS